MSAAYIASRGCHGSVSHENDGSHVIRRMPAIEADESELLLPDAWEAEHDAAILRKPVLGGDGVHEFPGLVEGFMILRKKKGHRRVFFLQSRILYFL